MSAIVLFRGNVCSDLKAGTDKNGGSHVMFTLALSDSKRNEAGEYVAPKNPVFIKARAFEPTSRYLLDNVTKGSRIQGEGQLRQYRMKDENGETTRVNTYIIINKPVHLVTAKTTAARREEDRLEPPAPSTNSRLASQPAQPPAEEEPHEIEEPSEAIEEDRDLWSATNSAPF